MKISCIFTVAVTLLLQVNTSTFKNSGNAMSPRALEDEVRQQLAELRAAVQGALFKGFDDLQALVDNISGERTTIVTETPKQLAEEHAGYIEQLAVVIRWAYSQGILLTTCLGFQYPVFMDLYDTCIERMDECMGDPDVELLAVAAEARYKIDLIINDVNAFDRQIDQCNGQILCLEPLVAAIEQAQVTIPLTIGVELAQAESGLKEVGEMYRDCRDASVAHMNDAGPGLLNAMVGCFQSQQPRPRDVSSLNNVSPL